jgi:hypothetical protein
LSKFSHLLIGYQIIADASNIDKRPLKLLNKESSNGLPLEDPFKKAPTGDFIALGH